MSMTMLRLDEIEDFFPEEILYYPGTQRLIVDRRELPDDFEERTPTLVGISPKQMEVTQQAIDEYLEPEIEFVYEFVADYEKEDEEEIDKLILYKNKYERYVALVAAFACIFFLISGVNELARSFSSLHKFTKQLENKEISIMAQNPQKDVLLNHSQPRASDWHEISPKVKIKWDLDTDVELEGVTTEKQTNEFPEFLTPLIPLAA